MFCSNCGKKLKEGAKFCSSCGEKPVVKEKEDRRKPAEVEIKIVQQNEKPKPKPNGCCTAIFVLFVISMVVSIFGYMSGSDTEVFSSLIGALFILGASAIVIWLATIIVKWLIKIGLKKPIALLIVLGIIAALSITAYLLYRSYSYDSLSDRVFFLEDKVTEIAAAKMLGDTIMKQGAISVSGVTLQNVNDAAKSEKSRIGEVSYPTELAGYEGVTSAWADKIAAAKDFTSWNAISDEPEKFDIQIPDSWVEGIFKQTVYDIAAVKDAGDIAIKNQDRSAMRFVAARLVAIDHLLTSLETYQAVANSGFIKPAYALTRTGNVVIKTRGPVCYLNGKSTICLTEAEKAVKSAKDIAGRFYTYTPPGGYTAEPASQSETGWNQSFEPIGEALDTANMQYLGGAGITTGAPDAGPQLSVREQVFRNGCRSRGGNPDPTSMVKTRLPTTESGYDCQLPNGCWEFMTAVSGRTYAGGNSGCPEQGLVPKAPVTVPDLIPDIIPNIIPTPNPNPTPTPVVTSYDGSYGVRYNYGNCSTNAPGVNLGNLGVFTDTLTVRNNVVSWSGGESAKIDSNGRATWSMNLSGMGNIQQIFNFTKSGVSGTFTFQVSTQGFGVGCNGSFSGSKN